MIGAGIAGLRAAIELSSAGRVVVLTKREVSDSNTQWAQGGIAAALSDDDEVALHLQDTLNAGDGLCDPEAVKVLVEEGPERIEELIAWGTQFDRNGTKLAFGREGAHSRNRILHAHGDSTGREIARALYAKVRTLPNISVCEYEFSTNLCADSGRVQGVHMLDESGTHREIWASAVLLASGGLGQLYSSTTNPGVATGDGVAMAFRAGAQISDMEFIQFHPTALYLKNAPRFLLSEALRGEGAYLRNRKMARFMPDYHPLAELAPRDVVARAIVQELSLESTEEPVVYLDLTHLDGNYIQKRFPQITATCLQYNIDITKQMIPIRPAAHYSMGGVRTDLEGRTSVKGLFAAGEAASTGVHGANRLASNSLLEGLVFGARAGNAMQQERQAGPMHSTTNSVPSKGELTASTETMIRDIQELMWRNVGIVRNGQQLKQAIAMLEEIKSRLGVLVSRRSWEAQNLCTAGLLVSRSALAREESRGAHYRTDFPQHNDQLFKKHTNVQRDRTWFQ